MALNLVDDECDMYLVEWYRYKIEIRLGQIVTYGTMLLIAIMTRQIVGTVFFLLFLLPLRKAAGGFHATSHWLCFVLSIGCFLIGIFVFPLMQKAEPAVNLAFVVVACILIIPIAPVIHPSLPQKADHKAKLQKTTLIILGVQVAIIFFSKLFKAPEIFINASCSGVLVASILLLWAKLAKQEGTVNYEDE